MTEENFQGQKWPQGQFNNSGSNTLGTGEGEIPLAESPLSKVDVRTMASDISSMKESGGSVTQPYSPKPVEPNIAQKQEPVSTSSANQSKSATAGKETFAPQDIGMPITTPSPTTASFGGTLKQGTNKKTLFIILLSTIIFVGLAAAAYFFIYPALFPKNGMDEITPPVPPVEEVVPPPAPEETPVVPPPAPEPTTEEKPTTIELHASFLKNPADLVYDIKLSPFSLETLSKAVPFESTSVPLFKEIVMKSNDNKPIAFASVAPLFAKTFFTPEVIQYFKDDVTVFSYTNNKGTWLGLITKLNDPTSQGTVQDLMGNLQKDPDLKNFFLTDPGTAGEWKDGSVLGKPTSQVSFSLPSSTLSYTWFDAHLLISTNLDGAKEAAKRLGY